MSRNSYTKYLDALLTQSERTPIVFSESMFKEFIYIKVCNPCDDLQRNKFLLLDFFNTTIQKLTSEQVFIPSSQTFYYFIMTFLDFIQTLASFKDIEVTFDDIKNCYYNHALKQLLG